MKKNNKRKWTRHELQTELRRRRQYPATTAQMGLTIPQAVTVAELEAELSTVAVDDEARGWHEWELALAKEHYRLTPARQFIRYIPA